MIAFKCTMTFTTASLKHDMTGLKSEKYTTDKLTIC